MTLKEKNRPVVLLWGSNRQTASLLENLSVEYDFKLLSADSAEQVFDFSSAMKPAMVLFESSGNKNVDVSVCSRLRNMDQTMNVPVVYVMQGAEEQIIEEIVRAGATDYISDAGGPSGMRARLKVHFEFISVQKRLQAEVTAKNKFFSIISHDLRNSFSIILSLVHILKENRDELKPAETTGLLHDIGETTDNTLALLENLLEWARTQNGTVKFDPVPLSINTMFTDVLKAAHDMATKKKVQLTALNPTDIPVKADRNMIQLVMRNLVSNAIKFTPENGKVTLQAEENGERVKISVTDTGVGILPAQMPKLFRLESRVTTQGTAYEQGNGLGLILCKEFVEFHGGEIGIESVPASGTTAWFTLPKQITA